MTIANQANAAEGHSLHDIAGMGYRKPLEFLIKDYCITLHGDDAPAINAAPSYAGVTTYVSDGNLKECATGATWLGNDETHLERIWTKHDNQDLKRRIRLTQNWIDNELFTC